MKSRKIIYVAAGLFVLGLAAAWLLPSEGEGEDADGISRVEAGAFMEAVRDTSVVVVDVRTAEEHREGCIPGTDLNLDVMSADFATEAVRLIPEKSVVAIYCRSGNRSRKAARILADRGYEVIELSTGYKGWKALGK